MSAPAAPPGLVLDLVDDVPGGAVRVGVPVLVLACAAVSGGGAVVWTVAAVVAGLVLVRPTLPAVASLPVLAATWVLGRPDLLAGSVGTAVRLAVLVLGVHLVVRLGGLAGHVAWTARVEAAVLRRAVVDVLRVQGTVQPLLAVTFAVRVGFGDATAAALRWLALPVVVLLVLLVLPRVWVRR